MLWDAERRDIALGVRPTYSARGVGLSEGEFDTYHRSVPSRKQIPPFVLMAPFLSISLAGNPLYLVFVCGFVTAQGRPLLSATSS